MGQILASTSQAAAATTTSAAFAFNASNIVVATCLNGATPPSQTATVALQLTLNGTTWYTVDTRDFGIAPSQSYYQVFELSQYCGGQPFANATAVQLSAGGTVTAWLNYRLVFSNNPDQAVTVAAYDANNGTDIAVVSMTATTSTSGGGCFAWTAPSGTAVYIEKVILNVTTASTGAANLNVGVAANGTTSANNLMTTLAVGTAGVYDNLTSPGGSGKSGVACPAGSYVTATASATLAGLVGTAYIRYLRLP